MDLDRERKNPIYFIPPFSLSFCFSSQVRRKEKRLNWHYCNHFYWTIWYGKQHIVLALLARDLRMPHNNKLYKSMRKRRNKPAAAVADDERKPLQISICPHTRKQELYNSLLPTRVCLGKGWLFRWWWDVVPFSINMGKRREAWVKLYLETSL